MKTLFAMVALGGALALGAVGCSSSNCGPSNCTGCCDANNNCQMAASDHCGQGGEACATCTASQSCVLGACQFGGGNNNGGNNGGTNGNNTSTTGNNTSTTGQTNTTGTTSTTSTTASTTGSTGSFDCSAQGPCPNDPAPTSTSISQCQTAENDPNCGTQFLAYANCAVTNNVCDSSGKSSVPAGDCTTELTNYTNCLQAHSTTTGTTASNTTGTTASNTTGTTATNSNSTNTTGTSATTDTTGTTGTSSTTATTTGGCGSITDLGACSGTELEYCDTSTNSVQSVDCSTYVSGEPLGCTNYGSANGAFCSVPDNQNCIFQYQESDGGMGQEAFPCSNTTSACVIDVAQNTGTCTAGIGSCNGTAPFCAGSNLVVNCQFGEDIAFNCLGGSCGTDPNGSTSCINIPANGLCDNSTFWCASGHTCTQPTDGGNPFCL